MRKTFDILCVRKGLERKKAAEMAGFSVSNYSTQINKERFNFEKVKGLARVFGMSLSEFMAVYEQEDGFND